ncbi:hypothetical protein COT62_02385 [Candidatus Roizmanbacteria bacterium CG09_land_8_20_14_0_10_41_9]|uniref:Gas vesicle protein n=1 Tax=Candidatus Roizmanbacteria bacterium CG09_land_8_20_14_0_10_41_9 TaxID=1974850 RepID=A0A2H0WSR4_9BACT|nr:MAG: hypothetical protein COT62_02385 [Candidatus Roizmanbacteria bacterium CG09_land_8_20_14_0_10_41_9]
MNTKKSSKFGLGLLLGTVIGGITALFLSPNTGEENREIVAKKIQDLKKLMEEKEVDKKVKEIFGEVTEEAKNLYLRAKEELIEALAHLKESIENIDREKYMMVVEDVMKKVQKETKKEVKQLEKLKNHLLDEWNKLRP